MRTTHSRRVPIGAIRFCVILVTLTLAGAGGIVAAAGDGAAACVSRVRTPPRW